MPTLKALREEAALTQVELAESCGVSEMTVYYWEQGQKRPRPGNVRKLAEALHTTRKTILEAVQETRNQYEQRQGSPAEGGESQTDDRAA